MQAEIRDNNVLIKGYVCAVCRDSKLIKSKKGDFVEQVRSGTWQNAIDSNNDIAILLNHDWGKKLGSTKSNLTLKEDNIGLYAEIRTSNPEVVAKAKQNKLSGWSFRFVPIKISWGKTDKGIDRRYLDEITLKEVSILDDTKEPAYYGTSIEVRDGNNGNTERRYINDKIDTVWIDGKKDFELSKEQKERLKCMYIELEI
jgi:HK97 family phage prohead protease